jgi:hypothetical protein
MADPGGICEERGILPDLEKFFFLKFTGISPTLYTE